MRCKGVQLGVTTELMPALCPVHQTPRPPAAWGFAGAGGIACLQGESVGSGVAPTGLWTSVRHCRVAVDPTVVRTDACRAPARQASVLTSAERQSMWRLTTRPYHFVICSPFGKLCR